MKYIKNYKKYETDYIITESINLANKIKNKILSGEKNESEHIKKEKLLSDIINELKKVLNKSPNLIGLFFSYYIKEDIPVYSEEDLYTDSLSGLAEHITNNKNLLKQNLPKDIINYDKFEYLIDDINIAHDRASVKKFINGFFHSKLKRQIDLDNVEHYEMLLTYIKMKKEDRPVLPSTKSYGNINMFFRTLKNKLENVDNTEYKKSVLSKLNSLGKNNYRVNINTDEVLVIETFNKDIIKQLGGDWCIVNDQKKWFNNYVNPAKGNTQYLVFDFTKLPTEPNSLYGVTINRDGGTTNGMCQNRENRYVGLEHIINDLSLEENIFVPKYKDIPEKLRKYANNEPLIKLDDISSTIKEIQKEFPHIFDEIMDIISDNKIISFDNMIHDILLKTDGENGLDNIMSFLKDAKENYPNVYKLIKKRFNTDQYTASFLSKHIRITKDLPKTLDDFKIIYNKYKDLIKDIDVFGAVLCGSVGISRLIKYGKHINKLDSYIYKKEIFNNLKTLKDYDIVKNNTDNSLFLEIINNRKTGQVFNFNTKEQSETITGIIKNRGSETLLEMFEKREYLFTFFSTQNNTDVYDLIIIDSVIKEIDISDKIDLLHVFYKNGKLSFKHRKILHDHVYQKISSGIEISSFKEIYNTIKEKEDFDYLGDNIFDEAYFVEMNHSLPIIDSDFHDSESIINYMEWCSKILDNGSYQYELDSMFHRYFEHIADYDVDESVNFLMSIEALLKNPDSFIYLEFDIEYGDIIESIIESNNELDHNLMQIIKDLSNEIGKPFIDSVSNSPVIVLCTENVEAIEESLEESGYGIVNENDTKIIEIIYDDWYDSNINGLFDQENRLEEDYYENFEIYEIITKWNDTYAPEIDDKNKKILKDYFIENGFNETDEIEDILSENIENDDAYDMVDIENIINIIEDSIRISEQDANASELFETHTEILFEIFEKSYKEKGFEYDEKNNLVLGLSLNKLLDMVDVNTISEYIHNEGLDNDLDLKELIFHHTEVTEKLSYNNEVYGTIDEVNFNEILSEKLNEEL